MTTYKKRRGDRKDARLVRKIHAFEKMYPYIMRGRNESTVAFKQQLRVENARAFLRELNQKNNTSVTLFVLAVAALVRTIALRPWMNRFICGNRIYARDEIIVTFVSKQRRSEDAHDVILRIPFGRQDTLIDVARRINDQVRESRKNRSVLGEDKTIDFFLSLPRFLINAAVRAIFFLDKFDRVPKSILDIDPMRSSAFISNLGSYDIGAPFHHNYEWGNSSVFLVMGKTYKTPVVGKTTRSRSENASISPTRSTSASETAFTSPRPSKSLPTSWKTPRLFSSRPASCPSTNKSGYIKPPARLHPCRRFLRASV